VTQFIPFFYFPGETALPLPRSHPRFVANVIIFIAGVHSCALVTDPVKFFKWQMAATNEVRRNKH